MNLRNYIQNNFLLLDGAMGTMLQKAMRPGQRPDLLSITDPSVVESVHKTYFSAGSQLVYANTFGANAHKLEGTGYSVEEVISASIAAAKKAAGTHGLVALDIGSLGELLELSGSLSFENAYNMFMQQINQGVKSGADCIVIETMSDLNEVRAAVLAAKENIALPVFVSMTFEPTHRTFTGCPVGAMGVLLESMGVDAVGINCSLGPEDIYPIAEELSQWTSLPLLAKPNAGLPGPDGAYPVGPEAFAKQMEQYLPLGVHLFGGCCGTNPDTIAQLRQMLAAHKPILESRSSVRAVCTATAVIRLDQAPVLLGDSSETDQSLVESAFSSGDTEELLDLSDELCDAGASLFLIRERPERPFPDDTISSTITELQSMCSMPLAFACAEPAHLNSALRAYCGKALAFLPGSSAEWISLCRKYGAAVVVPSGNDPIAEWKKLRLANIPEQDRFLLVEDEILNNKSFADQFLQKIFSYALPCSSLVIQLSDETNHVLLQKLLELGIRLFIPKGSNSSQSDFISNYPFK